MIGPLSLGQKKKKSALGMLMAYNPAHSQKEAWMRTLKSLKTLLTTVLQTIALTMYLLN